MTVAIVTVFSACEKFLGFAYRIFLSRTIGAEGIGLYQVALSLFALLFTFACSGTPITVSRLITKYRAQGKVDRVNKVITAGLSYTLLIVVPLCLIFFLLGDNLGFLFADDRALPIFLILLPGLIFTSVYSVLRGVFWGNKDFLPYSVIELLEEICMIIVGIVLISNAKDVFGGAKSAGIAVLVSYILSFSLATFTFFFRKNKIKNPKGEFKPLLRSATPVTAMRTANSLITSLVSIILPLRLISAGFSSSQAMSAYGSAVGQTFPILSIPTMLIGSFVLVLTPTLSENFYKGKVKELKVDLEKAIKFTVFVSAIFVPVFLVCGEEIGILIFNSHESGKYLCVSAILTIFMGISSITTSILNSMGMEHKTLLYFIIGALLMLLSVILLPKYLGIYSLLLGFFWVYLLTSVFNLYLINKTCKEKPKYLKFIICSIIFILPTTFLGIMLEKLLLPLLGSFLTLFTVGVVLVVFMGVLYFGFNLISIEYIKSKIVLKRHKKRSAN